MDAQFSTTICVAICLVSGIDTKIFNNRFARHMTDTFSGFNSLCLLPASWPARLEDEDSWK